MALTGVYVWRKPIPTSLKVIHARMVAQAGVILGLCGAGIISLLSPAHPHTPGGGSVVNKAQFRETKGLRVPAAAPPADAPAPAVAPIKE